MSVGFYPELGMVLFGSEQAATKAAMGFTPVGCGSQGGRGQRAKWRKAGMPMDSFEHAMDSSTRAQSSLASLIVRRSPDYGASIVTRLAPPRTTLHTARGAGAD